MYLLLSSIISAPVLADATTPAADSITETNKTLSLNQISHRCGCESWKRELRFASSQITSTQYNSAAGIAQRSSDIEAWS